jgi:hypothetical protein
MASDPNAPRSRRALLAAAAGGAAAFAVTSTIPLTAAAADDDPVLVGSDLTGTQETSITVTSPVGDPQIAFRAHTVNPDGAGLAGTTGTETGMPDDTAFTGVFGWSQASTSPDYEGAGVWGVSPDDGVVGSGGLTGVLGLGDDGVVGIADAGDGVVGVGSAAGAGVRALAASPTAVGLAVSGKVLFSRAGKTTIGTGRSSLRINLAGVTANSRIFAVLHSNRSGRYVRAVVPGTGYFTIYLNTTVTSATFVAWFVIN